MRAYHRFGILSGLMLLSTASLAETPVDTVRSLNVEYVQADLADPAAAKALYGRIQRAARMVCDAPAVREIDRYLEYKTCYTRAVDAAVAAVGATALTAVHRGKTQASG